MMSFVFKMMNIVSKMMHLVLKMVDLILFHFILFYSFILFILIFTAHVFAVDVVRPDHSFNLRNDESLVKTDVF